MSISTHIDTARKVITSIAFGILTDSDLLEARRQMIADPDFHPSFDRIWDCSEVTQVELDDNVLAPLIATSLSEDSIFRAIVCRSVAPMAHVLDFIAQARRHHRPVAVFPTRADAERWIELQHANQPE
ncbi:MAG: hypothetical protein ABI946_08365 [Chthoniobacterales bacterium]